jgi:hypothetical protein
LFIHLVALTLAIVVVVVARVGHFLNQLTELLFLGGTQPVGLCDVAPIIVVVVVVVSIIIIVAVVIILIWNVVVFLLLDPDATVWPALCIPVADIIAVVVVVILGALVINICRSVIVILAKIQPLDEHNVVYVGLHLFGLARENVAV